MNKSKYLLTTLSLFIMLPSITYADCTPEEIKHFKEIEDEYKVTYEFNKETKDYTLDLYVGESQNYLYDLSTIPIDNFEIINEGGKSIMRIENILPQTLELKIVGVTETCNSILKNKKVELPKYNSYSEDPLCEGIEEFVLCQPTYEKEIDYDTFVSRVNTYKNTIIKKEQESKNSKENNNTILKYITSNIFNVIIIGIFIIIVIATIIITIKSIKKSRRLE